MKIEKINDNQIRCTLDKEDLETRNIKLSELAYGTGKTKELFQDMMQQANDDFGFEVNDIPLMVEAIPVSPDCIILVITKVDDPKERENHLSKFFSQAKDLKDELTSRLEDSGLNLGNFEEINSDDKDDDFNANNDNYDDSLLYSIYIFDSLNDIINVSRMLVSCFKGDSAVYKSPANNKYYLALCMESKNEKNLNKICGVLTENGVREDPTYAKELFYIEHFDKIIKENAIEKLGAL